MKSALLIFILTNQSKEDCANQSPLPFRRDDDSTTTKLKETRLQQNLIVISSDKVVAPPIQTTLLDHWRCHLKDETSDEIAYVSLLI